MPSPTSPSTGHLSIAGKEAGDVRTLRLSGELDMASGPALYARVSPLIYKAREVVVDLSGLTFMDSSGLYLLLRLRTVCEERGCRLLLASPSRQVRRVLEVTGLSPTMRKQGLLAE